MIKFTIECSNFVKAGEVEGLLKKAGVRYTTSMKDEGKKRTYKVGRKKLTAVDAKDIIAYLAMNRSETDKVVGEHFGYGPETVRRVRLGTHKMAKLAR